MLLLQILAVRCAGHRRNAVDHGIGKADVAFNPVSQLWIDQISEGQGCLAGNVTIVGQVIAGHYRKRSRAFATTSGERRAEQAEHADWRSRILQIMLDVRQRGVELTGAVIQTVPALGNGQRDDADGRIGKACNHRFRAIARNQQHVAEAANDSNFSVRPVIKLHQRIEMVLRGERVTHGQLIDTSANAADAPIETFACVHQRIGIGRLMGTMKTTYSDVCDTGRNRFKRVGGAGDMYRQLRQVLFIQLHVRPRWAWKGDSRRCDRCRDSSDWSARWLWLDRVGYQATCCSGWPTAKPLLSNKWQWLASSTRVNGSP